jgi:pimeloyl-ACP methyl ester carboxylesterase
MQEAQFEYRPSHKLRYLRTGTGRPLIILHGWGSSAELMSGLANSLSDIRDCIVPDMPGFGKSEEPPTAWDVSDYLKVIYRLVTEELELKEFDVLAHSFGGRIMMKWLSNDECIQKPIKVLLTGSAGLKPKRKLSFYYRKYLAKLLKAPFVILPEPLKSKAMTWLRTTSIWRSLGSSDYQQLSGVMRQTFVKTVTEFLDETMPQIKQEVFLLWGETDAATPMDQAKRLESGIKNAVLVTIPAAGHYAFLDKPAEFNAIARAYLEG